MVTKRGTIRFDAPLGLYFEEGSDRKEAIGEGLFWGSVLEKIKQVLVHLVGRFEQLTHHLGKAQEAEKRDGTSSNCVRTREKSVSSCSDDRMPLASRGTSKY